jgi:AcrB/AcrD/AcrF family
MLELSQCFRFDLADPLGSPRIASRLLGPQPSRLVKTGCDPIAMTTLAAILTLLPLALAIGQDSSMQQPLAVAIIAGLVVQLPLVLLVMPSIFLLLRRAP